MELLSQNPQLSNDPEIKGFDFSAGKSWIYPENYPIRDYQFNIVKSCLYTNTLVCLPTGLGKTFIAAVIMYNFWRWYPRGKVVFLAPTKPLVAQQIEACYNIMGIPNIETIQLTGAINQKQRETLWLKKRVIFATPQVFQNDLEKNIVPSDAVKCVIIDEAHKALGKHSYCECIRLLAERNQYFRILALSATPGNKIDNVHEVIQNLLIAHVELRDETSTDIVPYINNKKVDVILVPLSKELLQYKERYISIMDRHVKVLLQNNVIQGNTANISKGRLFYISKEYQKRTNKTGNYGIIMKTLVVLMSMYHAYELMIRNGLRAFYEFYQDHNHKSWLNAELQLQEFLDDIKSYLGPFPDAKALSKGAVKDISENLVFGHTKFARLKELLLKHFENNNNDTRAIVFVEYRQSVSEVYILLLQCQPVIRPQMFVGQAGQKQKQQVKALEDFKSNRVNVLISTSIGEEGLDVGEVDLIICFDVSQHSPIRLVQRMGRTGRKRDGHIIILVTDGREYETLMSTMARKDSLNHKILNTSNICSSLYQNSPRMVPNDLTPECLKMLININLKTPTVKSKNGKAILDKKDNKRQNNLKRKVNTESNSETGKSGVQFSIKKYLRNDQTKENDYEILTPNILQNNNRNVIKSSDVKILTSDKDSLEFLTLCALMNSEKQGNKENENNINESYIPQFPYINNFFNFSIPDTEILECLSTLNNTFLLESDEKKLDNHSENETEKNLYIDECLVNDVGGEFASECVFENTENVVFDKCIASKSRFEDILNDDESDKCDVSDNVEKNVCAPSVASERCEISKSENGLNTLENREFSRFEDILNDSSDDTEINCDPKALCDLVENFEKTLINNITTPRGTKVKDFSNIIKLGDSKLKTSEEVSKYSCTSPSLYSKDLNTSNMSQTNHKKLRLSLESVTEEADNESEKDMFEDDSVLLQVDMGQLSFIDKVNTPNKDKIEENMDGNENTVDMELRMEEWDDDFEISTNPIKNSTSDATEYSNKSVNKDDNNIKWNSSDEPWVSGRETMIQKNNTPVCKAGNDIEQNSSDNGWICARKPVTQKSNITVSKAENNIERNSSNESWISVREPMIQKTNTPVCKAGNNIEQNSSDDGWICVRKPVTQKSNISVKKAESDIERNFSDEGWISVRQPTNMSRDISQESISKKLANIKKRQNSVRCFPTNDSLDGGWFSNTKENRSPYFNKSYYDMSQVFNDTSFENKYESRKRKAKNVQNGEQIQKHRKRLNKAKNEFIDDEADISSDCSTTDGSSGTDEDLEGFVSYTQDVHDSTDMHGHYLKSVRSPVKKPNGFIFKEPRALDAEVELYSQPLSQQDDTYVNDSFCVAGNEVEDAEIIQEECILEKAERILMSRKRKRRERKSNNYTGRNKRRNIIKIDICDSSTEDEIEMIRKQIGDETQLT